MWQEYFLVKWNQRNLLEREAKSERLVGKSWASRFEDKALAFIVDILEELVLMTKFVDEAREREEERMDESTQVQKERGGLINICMDLGVKQSINFII